MPIKNSQGLYPRRLAHISHNYNQRDKCGLWDYSESYSEILARCDSEQCDTVVFALYTWDTKSRIAKTHATIFGNSAHVRRVLLEAGDLPADAFPKIEDLTVEVWQREATMPIVFQQRFSGGGQTGRSHLIADLPERLFDRTTLVIICGESGIVREKRAGGFRDDFGFMNWLDANGVLFILNPIHDFMGISHGIDMRNKRKHYSCGGRTVFSVWNQGNGRDAEVSVPWTVFCDGKDVTNTVRELVNPIAERPDLRIGVFDVTS